MAKRILKRGLLSESMIKGLLRAGYFSAKGKKVAKEVIAGKHNKQRYKYK